MPEVRCRYFSGYKPCQFLKEQSLFSDSLSEDIDFDKTEQICNSNCPQLSIPANYIIIIHLEAIGAVVRATGILPAIKRKYPNSHITWVTQSPSQQILIKNSLIDRVLTTSPEDILQLSALDFDIAFCIDKSLKASGVLNQTKYKELFGFITDRRTGAVLPANIEAQSLWEIGLSDFKKFKLNKKTENQLMFEALNLGQYQRDPYQVPLDLIEKEEVQRRKTLWLKNSGLRLSNDNIILGINTGCSSVIPYKKLSISFQRKLIEELLRNKKLSLVLLGGKEDKERNLEIAKNLEVICSDTELGLRDGLMSVAACDIIISGDSLGMHLAIAQEKWVVAWFGPTCAHEIDLFDRGVKIISKATCGPCWKRYCDKKLMCYDLVELSQIIEGVEKGIEWKSKFLSSKPLSLETCS